MKTSSDCMLNKRCMKKSTHPPGDGDSINSIFSYLVKRTFPTFTLYQKETGITLTLEMEKLEETLRVTRFIINRNSHLRTISEDLCGAAETEIMLQALICVFFHAEHYGTQEILFILLQSEAIEISFFNGLFEEVTSVNFGEEKRVSSRLTCIYQEYFLKEILLIKSKIYKELWVRQKDDDTIRSYLQNRHIKNFSLLRDNLSFAPQSSVEGKIISFPINMDNSSKKINRKVKLQCHQQI